MTARCETGGWGGRGLRWAWGIAVLGMPSTALAGMPFIVLTEVGETRLTTLSFFLALFVGVAAGVKALWGVLRREHPTLPPLSFKASLAGVLLWGLLFHLVLTMISGARELMTPGAWVKDGATYKLAAQAPRGGADRDAVVDGLRRARIEALRQALWVYAEAHGGALPAHDRDPALPTSTWLVEETQGTRYVYLPQPQLAGAPRLLAVEPDALGSPRLGLFTDGSVRALTDDALQEALQ